MNVDPELSPREVKRLASHMIGRLERNIDQQNGQFVSVSGWLSTSLFAANGGGAIAALGALDQVDQPGWAATMFISGLIASLLSGVLIQFFLARAQPIAEGLLRFWREAEDTEVADSEEYDVRREGLTKLERWYWTAPSFGWLAGLLFLIGCAVLAVDVGSPPPKREAACRDLQARMLNLGSGERARRLYDSLHCAWQE